MQISKRTWCPVATCDGEFIRLNPVNQKKLDYGVRSIDTMAYWLDSCTKCKAQKFTDKTNGNISYAGLKKDSFSIW